MSSRDAAHSRVEEEKPQRRDQSSRAADEHERHHAKGSEHATEARRDDEQQQHHPEISLTQRMMSASVGSFFTSVLATPLDVVRVRLQSQSNNVPRSIRNIQMSASSSQPSSSLFFKELPPNLGITSCCREVFWVGNNAPFCIAGAGPLDASATSAGTATTSSVTTAPESCAIETTKRHTFTSTFDGLRKIARNEGIFTLWRGLSPTLLMGVPANVIYFTGYDWLRLDPRSPAYKYVPDSYAPLICGSVARMLAATSISPIEMFRTRLQATAGKATEHGHFRDTLRGLWRVTQIHGYSALWRGLPLTLWRDVPFSGMYWFGYEKVRNFLTDMRARALESKTPVLLPHEDPGEHHNLIVRQAEQSEQTGMATFVDAFVSGCVSGSIAALITTPFDVGKTRQQVFRQAEEPPHSAPQQQQQFKALNFQQFMPNAEGSSRATNIKSSSPLKPEQLSIPRFLLHIFREEGFAGLLRGWIPRCLKVAPSCGIMISSYEVCKKIAQQLNERTKEEDGEGEI